MKRLSKLLVSEVFDDLEPTLMRKGVVPDQKAGQRFRRAITHGANVTPG